MIPNHPEEIGDDLQHYELQGETHDVVLAARVAHLYRHDIEVAPGGRWYYFDKHRGLWRHDLDKAWVRRAIEITIRHYAVSNLPKEDARTRKHLLSAKKIRDVLSLVADRRYDFDNVGFDRNLDLAGLPKGRVVELRTGEIRDATREDRLTMSLGVTPKKGDCPRFKQFLCEAIPDEATREYVLRWLGYALTGHTASHAFICAFGKPGTGKSTLARLMLHIMGDYALTVAGEHIAGWKDTHRQWIARLDGKRLIWVDELPKGGGTWRTADVNSLVSGEPMEANYMRQNSFQFTPVCKLYVLGNDKPAVSSESGIFRRMRPVEFDQVPEKVDEQLDEHLCREAPQILDMLIGYATGWYQWRLGTIPERVSETLDEYREDSRDLVLADAIGSLEMPPNGAPSWLLSAIRQSLKSDGVVCKQNQLTAELKRRGWERARVAGKGNVVWVKP